MVVNHRGDLDALELGSPVNALSVVVKLFALGSSLTFHALTLGEVAEHEPGEEEKENDVQPAHDLVDVAEAFEVHNNLGADFHADDGTNKHGQAEFVVNVAELGVTESRNQ